MKKRRPDWVFLVSYVVFALVVAAVIVSTPPQLPDNKAPVCIESNR